jgi:hypothetical protein
MTVDTTEAGVGKVVAPHIGNIYKGKRKQDEKLRARIQKLCGVELKRIERLPKPPAFNTAGMRA